MEKPEKPDKEHRKKGRKNALTRWCHWCHAIVGNVGALRLRFAVERGAPSLNALLGSLEAKDCRGRGVFNEDNLKTIWTMASDFTSDAKGWQEIQIVKACKGLCKDNLNCLQGIYIEQQTNK